MTWGFFGAFIFGFLGTAMPRMLEAAPLRLREVGPLVLLHVTMTGSFATGQIFVGDMLSFCLLALFASFVIFRVPERKDLPPPGFVLVGLAFACAGAGALLAILEHRMELDARWIALQRSLTYQGFVLLPVLGIGPFLLPRFLGMPTPDLPESTTPTGAWLRKAGLAASAGLLILVSFYVEALAWHKTAYALRFGVTLVYLLLTMPLHRAPKTSNSLGLAIRLSLAGIVAGFLVVALFPAYRVALLHLALIGGFAVITLTVATRVMFGHSGNLALLKRPNRWLLISIGLMLLGMATRISGDFWPKILPSHYSYGALLWIVAVMVWAAFTFPKVLIRDNE
jgi:hypothetical protein